VAEDKYNQDAPVLHLRANNKLELVKDARSQTAGQTSKERAILKDGIMGTSTRRQSGARLLVYYAKQHTLKTDQTKRD
jgi:hypothetical protein